ncbi:NADH-ubiquinone oxidoreductase chain E [hydrothermal vent metagenome]|uniref:NADH-ubiquinone oxidoreductase chain E n=1 Tax=hydrothermal vent metagenome TaxID=652676 RepID=A0A3B0U0W5_9ZZZZ
MSVRRLAEDAVQPESFAFSKENADWAKTRIALYPKGREQSAIIPLLMRAQDQEGWVSRAAIEKIAAMLDMPNIRALEVATFYTQFQLKPVGTKAHVQVCGTTPCMLRGAEGLRKVCEKKINAKAHQTNADGTLSWEEVECLGACVNAPMVAIGHDTYEDLTPERLEEIIDAFENDKGDTIKPGPQNGREYSAPITGQTTLLNLPESAAQAPERSESATGALFERPKGEADDLKLISGVGPVLEKKLIALGVIRFDQLAAFGAKEIDALDDALNFKGRIVRDQWTKQAAALVKGEAEYIRQFGKKPR